MIFLFFVVILQAITLAVFQPAISVNVFWVSLGCPPRGRKCMISVALNVPVISTVGGGCVFAFLNFYGPMTC